MVEVRLQRKGQSAMADEISKMLKFVEPSVREVFEIDEMTVGIEFNEDRAENVDRVSECKRIIMDYVKGFKNFKTVDIRESKQSISTPVSPDESINPEIVSGVRLKIGIYHDFYKFLIERLDKLSQQFDAVRMSVPSMISIETVKKAGYFKKFPNLANFIMNFKHDYNLFMEISKNGLSDGEALLNQINMSGKMLNPVTCFHIYPNATHLISKSGKSNYVIDGFAYRYESHNMNRTRLNEFHIHEMVFFGDEEYVTCQRKKLLEEYLDLFDSWELDFNAQTSSDVFYANDAGTYMATQKFENAKIEVNAKTDKGYLSIGSFNLHGPYYGDTFNIQMDGVDKVYSGCGGVGLERIVYVVFSQYGDDVDQWPGQLQNEFKSYLDRVYA